MSALSKRALPVFGLATVLILVLFALAVPPARAASIVVNSAADTTVAGDGACTLREAINNANSDSDTTGGDCTAGSGADDITFTANTTITLGGTQLPTVTTEMTITGNGAANTIIEAQTCNPVAAPGTCTPIESRVFELDGSGNLTLDGVTVRHGHCLGACDLSIGNFGGGILNAGGTLAVTNSTISSNSAEVGGGIMDFGTLTVTNSTIAGNSATDGGGIFANNTVTLTDSTIAGNSADSGGGLYGFAMTVTNSNVSGNSAQLAGGGIYLPGGTLDVTTSTLLGNMTDGDGGGIWNAGTLTLTGSTLSGNSAERGGGIYNDTNGSNTTVTNSTLSSNSADIGGGGIYNNIGVVTVTSSTLSSNSAERGGGIYNDTNGTTTTVTNSTLSGNTAERDGGGIYNNIGQTTVTNSTLFGNMADDGGGIYTAFNAGFAGTTTLVRSLIAGNSASTADEIQHLAGVPLNANAYNVFGYSGLTNADAFSGFTPSGTDVTATSDGTVPTALAGILDPALQNNGGPTDTHALVSGSPAIDLDTVGDCTAAPVNGVDQRGETRPQGAGCDAGAYETAGSVTPGTATLTVTKETDPDGGTGFPFTLSAPSSYSYERQWGSQGSGDGQFDFPQFVAVDATDNIYVADASNNRIQLFDSSGTYLSQFGSFGVGDGQLYGPAGVAVDASGTIYVVDVINHRVQLFESSGTYLSQFGSTGSGDGQFSFPYGVAVDAAGTVYVADANNNRIQLFDSSGTYLSQFGSLGVGNGQFISPNGVAVDAAGTIYVADSNNNRIQLFDSSGTYLSQFGSTGSGDGQFNFPYGVAVDAAGTIYVADTFNHRIQLFDSSGTYLSQFGSLGSGDGQFNVPTGVAVDAAGNIYVADSANNRIQVFKPEPAPANFNLDDDQSEVFDLSPGQYTISEAVPSGWTLSSINCGNGPITGQTSVTLDLAADDDVTCTFTNTQDAPTTGTITIIKDANPEGSTVFSFTDDIESPNSFTLVDDGTSTDTKTFSDVPTGGSYTVTETDRPGWPLTDLQCSWDLSTVSTDLAGGYIVVENLDANDTVECTFSNTQCQPGTYDAGGNECVPADPGNFVDQPEAIAQTQCQPGRWQDQSGADSCKLADPGFYVPDPGATEQIACPAGTTSEAGATECTPIDAGNTCPVDPAVGGVNIFRTNIYGTGMGSLNRARTQAKLIIPNAGDTTALYGQMAARTFSGVRFVRFMYPRAKDGYVQVQPETDLGVDKAISWWGAPLDETLLSRPYIKGRWFLLKGARKFKLQRAFVIYATQQQDAEYASNWTTFTSPNNFVAPTAAFPQEVTNTLGIPETQATTDLTVQVALVDINVDDRTVDVTVRAGGVEVTQTIMKPDKRKMDLLNIETFVLPNVPAGVDEVEIVVKTALDEGDSAGLLGASAWYECVEVEGPDPEPDR